PFPSENKIHNSSNWKCTGAERVCHQIRPTVGWNRELIRKSIMKTCLKLWMLFFSGMALSVQPMWATSFFSRPIQLSPTNDPGASQFGTATVISGNTAAVGAPGGGGGGGPGSVFVYVRTGGAWRLQQQLTASNG